VSTSANISGENTPEFFSDIDQRVLEAVDYVVNLRRLDKTRSKPSVIVKLDRRGHIKFIRR
jgi:L-threonylcarbamoyladenylate synthase